MIKKEKGITLVSLVIVIAMMLILASTVTHMSLERFEINKINKMISDLELLRDKVLNYYSEYKGLPILRDTNNSEIKYTYSTLNFNKNAGDNVVYYILDLESMEGIALNYGEEGFENPNTSDDVYIINELTHTIYYVKGIELKGITYHYIDEYNDLIDNIPPAKPQINIISGTKTDGEIYVTNVEIEIVAGKDNWSGIGGTLYSIDNGATWNELDENNNVYTFSEEGTYTVRAKSYDKAATKNYSEEAVLTFQINKPEI